MRVKQFNDEVVFADDETVKIQSQDISLLKDQAMANKGQRMRLCAHRNIDETIHEMFVVHTKEAYVKPHKHLNKIESFHVIEGLVDVIMFDDEGNITDVIQMGDYSSGKVFFQRCADRFYHSMVIRSDTVVFHETTNGPFRRSDTEFAPWAADETDSAATKEFIDRLPRDAANFLASQDTALRAGGE